MACISDFSSNDHVIFLVGTYFFFQWKENHRDGPSPDFSGIPDFFFLPPWKKKTEPGKLTIFFVWEKLAV